MQVTDSLFHESTLITSVENRKPHLTSPFSLDLYSNEIIDPKAMKMKALHFKDITVGLRDDVSIYSSMPPGFLAMHRNFIRQAHVSSSRKVVWSGKKPRLLYIQRLGRRKLVGASEKISLLAHDLGYHVKIWSPEDDADDLVSTLETVYGADVIVGSFGSELTNIIYMRCGASVIMFCPCLNMYMSGVNCSDIYFRNAVENLNGNFHALSEELEVYNCSGMPGFQTREFINWNVNAANLSLSIALKSVALPAKCQQPESTSEWAV
mmetsp:Transcript_7357/g.30608  ORF Transcript_7357/g.30608 Transcript_7357/m.30608 type:complete len:265 (-) Transcript_7357:658-1452(-)